MPTYEYRCDHCEHILEKHQKISEDPLKTCPKCKKDSLQRYPSGGLGISFKGSGFYATDYKSPKKEKCCKSKEKCEKEQKSDSKHQCCCSKKIDP